MSAAIPSSVGSAIRSADLGGPTVPSHALSAGTADSHAAVLASRGRVQQEAAGAERRAAAIAQAGREEEGRRLEVEARVTTAPSHQTSGFKSKRSGSITGTTNDLRRQFLEAAEAVSTTTSIVHL